MQHKHVHVADVRLQIGDLVLHIRAFKQIELEPRHISKRRVLPDPAADHDRMPAPELVKKIRHEAAVLGHLLIIPALIRRKRIDAAATDSLSHVCFSFKN